jgi:hypothetical protein
MDREFIEMPLFSQQIRSRKTSDVQLREIEKAVCRGAGAIIPGTGGYYKLRLATKTGGKRGGWRVIYLDYPDRCVSVLVDAYYYSAILAQEYNRTWPITSCEHDVYKETWHGCEGY